MKILLLTKNYHGNRCSGNLDEQLELARQATVTFLGVGYPDYTENMDLKKYCRDHGDFDIIYYSQCTTENPGTFQNVAETNIPKVAYMHDGHNYKDAQIQRINSWDTSLLLFRSWASHIFEYAQRLHCPLKFFPQAINPEVFHDYGMTKTFDVCSPGIQTPFYPLRVAVQRRLTPLNNVGELKVKFAKQVSASLDLDKEYTDELKAQGVIWREDYAKAMNSSKITITDGGLFNDFVRRYLEALACKSLLLAAPPYLYERYDYLPYKRFVPVNLRNWEREMRYYLEHYAQFYKSIVEPSYEWVMQYHTEPVRTAQLLKMFEQVLNSC